MTVKERFAGIIAWFAENRPDDDTELHYRSPYELLVAVMLSAQCTDKRVNLVTPALFERFPTAHDLAGATPDEVFEYIRSVSYPRSKSEHLVAMAQRLEEVYGGRVPDTVEELTTLQGVGRKTANVIVSIVYDKPAMAVDRVEESAADGTGAGAAHSGEAARPGAPLADFARPVRLHGAGAEVRDVRHRAVVPDASAGAGQRGEKSMNRMRR